MKPSLGYVTDCHIVDVHDGDTVTIEITKKINVRLLRCWANEIHDKDPAKKAQADLALKSLSQLALGKQAVLFVPGSDRDLLADAFTFGRALGYLWVDGVNLSQAQVSAGLATEDKVP